ncbi:MAG TPA: electron transport complex subunit E [Candidatus Krumholzibacteria bacterium]|nr:electron transport complex subunit E [Candidatus Krumholzibacteria bacterium]HPD70512.1 electron transport complex subunit E [Candidatus Krumholzibacteria bacterium]HRY39788.1 electron transport complex subunit E [Candidatus Krumholzibacteria bacterium]
MSKQTSISAEFLKGLWEQSPTLRQLLGLCPTLAVTTAAANGVGMGLATAFVLVCASLMISLVRKLVPGQVRIATYVVVVAAFVTVVDLTMKAKFPAMSKSLGAFIPLIVVNCIILGRAEAFASKNGPFRSVVDALGMGVGFTAALTFLGGVREILGNGSLFGVAVMPADYDPWIVMILPAGGFFALGLTLGAANIINRWREQSALRAARVASAAKEA